MELELYEIYEVSISPNPCGAGEQITITVGVRPREIGLATDTGEQLITDTGDGIQAVLVTD